MGISKRSQGKKIENAELEDSRLVPTSNPIAIEVRGDEFWPLSGKPFFHIILAKSHLYPLYQMGLPSKIHSLLPSRDIPTFLSYKGKEWKMVYYGKCQYRKRFDSSWKTFTIDNKLKVGDACVFELMEFREDKIIFRAQILRGDIPSKFEHSENGESADTPIFIG
ncbi:hypothetical protein JRO89_XS04G0084500 [Xanthoceras sorbifolium]|uniref:TF-B3 domain-containing protein n=1 Tax=Xanthoceras sorbifolium TaxID=99658 RepID=A0ABQ8I4L3_9ROSI|nr:hypothetical protein JRO89_XS04G0084500 [Xanthoceras sorbifolium]